MLDPRNVREIRLDVQQRWNAYGLCVTTDGHIVACGSNLAGRYWLAIFEQTGRRLQRIKLPRECVPWNVLQLGNHLIVSDKGFAQNCLKVNLLLART